jgi:catechol 2,3-dioxygenase-like lactoylglutathione lyase family enzyme
VASPVVALDHVQVAAPPGCEQEARCFYGGLLGLEEIAKPAELEAAGGVWFACGAGELHVGVSDEFAPAAKATPPSASRACRRSTSSPGACAGRARRSIRTTGCRGTGAFYTRDPWGDRVELLACE